MARDYYGISDGDTYGHSVFATEHSTTTIYGMNHEHDAFRNFLKQSKGQIASIVSDSYDYFNAVKDFCTTLKKDVDEFAESGGRLVIRPDSGDPVEVTIQTLEILEKYLPIEKNSKKYKLLPPHIGIVYGDGLDERMIQSICYAMLMNNWAIDARNVIFGMGGGLLQSANRDTYKFALKCSAAQRDDGEWFDVYKQPKTMSMKASKKGRFVLIIDENGEYVTYNDAVNESDCLELVYENGMLLRDDTLTDIRNRVSDHNISKVK